MIVIKMKLEKIILEKVMLVYVTICLTMSTAYADPHFPLPPNSKSMNISQELVVNSIPMESRQFTSKQSKQDVIEFYKNLWREELAPGIPGYKISKIMPPWTVISRIEDNHLLTVQVKKWASDTSLGYIAISKIIPDKKHPIGKDIPRLSGTDIMNDIYSEDGSKKGRTTILRNTHTLMSNVNYYRNYYNKFGWLEEMDHEVAFDHSYALRFRNMNKHITLVITRGDGQTYITAQHVSEGIF
tara:strand:- start:480 stop:1205 length:726 start_codon:yes stop_codon:yes gene_type:complete